MAEKQSLGNLVSGVTEDLSSLIRGEIELAKTELRDSAQVASKGAGPSRGCAGRLGLCQRVDQVTVTAYFVDEGEVPYAVVAVMPT